MGIPIIPPSASRRAINNNNNNNNNDNNDNNNLCNVTASNDLHIMYSIYLMWLNHAHIQKVLSEGFKLYNIGDPSLII